MMGACWWPSKPVISATTSGKPITTACGSVGIGTSMIKSPSPAPRHDIIVRGQAIEWHRAQIAVHGAELVVHSFLAMAAFADITAKFSSVSATD